MKKKVFRERYNVVQETKENKETNQKSNSKKKIKKEKNKNDRCSTIMHHIWCFYFAFF